MTQKFAKRLRNRMTKAETIIWKHLKGRALNGLKFRRQHPIPPFVVDFASIEIKLIIEIDGATHSSHKEIEYDKERTSFLENSGWKVIRIWNMDIYDNLGGVLDYVSAHIKDAMLLSAPPPSASLTPPPPCRGGQLKEVK